MIRTVKSIVQSLRRKCTPVPPPIVAQVSTLHENQFLKNRRILITGGGKGLGFAIAERCVSCGAEVLICGRDIETLQTSAQKLNCAWRRLDMMDVSSFSGFIDNLFTDGGFHADTLVCNAGISLHEADFIDVTPESFDKQIATNLRGAFFLAQAFVKKLLSLKDKGNILFISSETGETPDLRPYGWTKAATNSMAQGLAYRLSRDRIRVNAIAPGVTATGMTGFGLDDLTYNASPTGRAYIPEEIAEIAAFLISDLAAPISGQIITCNNARTINARWRE